MQKPTCRILSATTLLSAVLLISLAQREGRAKDEVGPAPAQRTWSATCQKCHTVPDETFETGRAFLAQITETS